MQQFEQTKRTKVNRTANRASYDRELFNFIIDEVKFGHVAFSDGDNVHSIPMLVWRNGDYLHIHCSVGSRLAKLVDNQTNICISFATIDGYVFAKSAFKHSVNYKSAVIYGKCELVTDDSEKLEVFKKLIQLYDKNRWEQVRIPNSKELAATALLKLPIVEAVVKVRTGPPIDKEDDQQLDVWAGVIPLLHQTGTPMPHEYNE